MMILLTLMMNLSPASLNVVCATGSPLTEEGPGKNLGAPLTCAGPPTNVVLNIPIPWPKSR